MVIRLTSTDLGPAWNNLLEACVDRLREHARQRLVLDNPSSVPDYTIIEGLTDTFKEYGATLYRTWDSDTYTDLYLVEFESDEDVALFLLRWS